MIYNLQETGHWCIGSQTFVKWVSLQLHLVLVFLEPITVIRGSLAQWILKVINIHRIEGQSRWKPFLLEKKIGGRISLRQDHQRQNQSQGLHLVPDLLKWLMYSLHKYSSFYIRPTYFAWFDKLRNTQNNLKLVFVLFWKLSAILINTVFMESTLGQKSTFYYQGFDVRICRCPKTSFG